MIPPLDRQARGGITSIPSDRKTKSEGRALGVSLVEPVDYLSIFIDSPREIKKSFPMSQELQADSI